MSAKPAASDKLLLRTLAGTRSRRVPIWLMRQAGRYLPEYREIRAGVGGFLDLCFTPHLASEVTLQPIRRFGFDAAILFSDILVVPHALGQAVTFETGEGPRLPPIETAADLARLSRTHVTERLAPVFETIVRVREGLGPEIALIGFCGAPWTVASYMIAGRGTPDQRPARMFAYREPALFAELMELLIQTSVDYLERQFEAGVEAVQIFDSWSGVLPDGEFDQWCFRPMQRMVEMLKQRRPGAPTIVFSRVGSAQLTRFATDTLADAVGLDTVVPVAWAAGAVQARKAVQGNLDPLRLLAGGIGLDAAVDHILSGFAAAPHIFNLGHGILPETPIAHVEQLVRRVRASA